MGPGEDQTAGVTVTCGEAVAPAPPVEPGRRREVLALAALAAAVAVPLVVSGARLAAGGWTPTLDDGVIATRSFDVFSTRSPALGQYSLASAPGAPPTHSPGPLLYWLLAVPTRFAPSWGTPVVLGLVSGLLLAAVVVLAGRRGGLAFATATTVGLILLVRAIGIITLVEVWNPWVSLLPFLVLVMLTWSVIDGDRHLFPAAVLAASFVMQTHLTYMVPAASLLLVALVGGWGGEAHAAWDRRRAGPARSHDSLRRSWLPLVAATGIGALCWASPLFQQLTGHPGNITLVARAGGTASQRGGLDAARASMGRTLGMPPRWTRPRAEPVVDIFEGIRPGPLLGQVTGALVVLALGAVLVHAIRTGDRVVAGGAATAATATVAMVVVAASLPLDRGLVVGYSFQWFRIAGLFVWLLLGLAAARWLPRRWARHGDMVARRGAAAVVVGAVSVGVFVLGLTLPRVDPIDALYEPAARLGDRLVAATVPSGTYSVRTSGPFELAFLPALVWRLRSEGRDPIVRADWERSFGDGYGRTGRRCDGIVILQSATDPLPARARVVTTVGMTEAVGLPPRARLALVPDTDPGGSC